MKKRFISSPTEGESKKINLLFHLRPTLWDLVDEDAVLVACPSEAKGQ
ncbi:MAG: hypothetical protein Q7S82_04040 [bacterium]|nr:hypothetical protein [bacterium]